MTGKRYFLLLLQLVWLADATWAQQRSPYSLQAAVDELHRREAAKFPLNAPPSQQHYLGEQDYWDDDTDFPAYTNNNLRNRHRLNKVLAKNLERENYDANNGGLSLWPFGGYEFDADDDNNNNNMFFNEKKRSTYFRGRDNDYDNGPASVFRERETQISTNPEHAELTEQFLREIEEAQEHEREERYKDALRNLWEKYQQQENEVEGDLFEEKKRLRTPPYYMLMQKKRSYPVLPWLPYKKRFSVTKRAAKRSLRETPSLGKTEDKVAKELSELFGEPVEEKKKRSVEEQSKQTTTATNAPNTAATTAMHTEKENSTAHDTQKEQLMTNGHAEHHQHKHEHAGHTKGEQHKSHKHRKHSGDHSHEQNSEEIDSEEGDEHDENDEHDEHDEDEEEEEEEDEGEERKKKRDLNKEMVSPAQVLHEEMLKSRRKKSIDWSKYFGLDRKKKSSNIASTKADTNDDGGNAMDKKNIDLDPDKLDSMNKKLQSIEDFILAETIKYTGAHEGISNPDEIRRVKDHVLSRLATAYSLEKMRLALEKLRQSVDKENHLLRNIIEPDSQSEESNSLEARKRLSVKKESAQTNDALHHEKVKDSNSNALQNLDLSTSHNQNNENNEDDDDELNKKKKRNSYLRYPEQRNDFSDFETDLSAGHYEPLNDAYLGNKNYMIGSNQCPLIESMAERCRNVDLLSGDLNQELLPICGVYQICYLCGFSQGACDYQYLAEADNICGYNTDCHAAARSVLMILRGSPGPQLGPRECVKNPCLQRVMREIGL